MRRLRYAHLIGGHVVSSPRCFYCSLICFAVRSLKQKLLASGVQMESDLEELDDEVMTCLFGFTVRN